MFSPQEVSSHLYTWDTFQAKYISQCMEDIKQELRQDNLSVKSNAIAKLTYVIYWSFHSLNNTDWLKFQLQMLGYDISWAGFNIIEVMSSNKFTLKRIGYLAASQSFHCDSEVFFIFTMTRFRHNNIITATHAHNEYDQERAQFSQSVWSWIGSDIFKLFYKYRSSQRFIKWHFNSGK